MTIVSALTALCALTTGPALAHAAHVDDAWRGHPAQPTVHALAAEFDVTVTPHPAWTADDLAQFLIGMRALPPFMVEDLGAITLERQRRACHHGMGRYNRLCPTFQDNTFFLYDIPPIQGEGTTRKLGILTRPERVKLLRRRAAIHLVTARFDAVHEWSLDRRWRSINGWNDRGTSAFNEDVWGYSRFLGMRSAHFDLVTFAEEYFARPEDILRDADTDEARARLNAYDWDITLACQQFTKIRILSKAITSRDPTWVAPPRGPEGVGPLQQCEQYQQWAQLHAVEGIDLLLAAATSDRPESLYGHLLLTVRYKDGATLRSRGFEPVFQYGAITDTNVSKLDYFSKGLFGGFSSLLQPNTFRGTDRLFLQYEQRALRRYALNLSPAQLSHMMQRLWEAERHVVFPYYFLSDNCASMLIDLVEPAVDELEIPQGLRWVMMPTEVLDVLARVQNGDRGPLLVKRAEVHFSSREVAMDAVPRKRAHLRELLDILDDTADPSALATLRHLDTEMDANAPGTRRDAYKKAREHVIEVLQDALPELDPEASERAVRAAIDYLYYASRIERYFMDMAFYKRRTIHAQTVKNPVEYTAEQQLEMRRDLYEIEDLQTRQKALMSLAQLSDERMRFGDRRPFTAREKAELAKIERTQAAYLASLDALATTIETFDPDLDGVAFIDDKRTEFERVQRRRDDMAMGPPGKGRFIVGGAGGALNAPGENLPAQTTGFAEVSASMIHERLGEQRRRGFRSDIASRALGLDGVFRAGPDFARNMELELTLFEFMTTEQKLGAVRESWSDTFGWGVGVTARHDGRRGANLGGNFEIGYTLPLWTRDHVANFWVIGTYLSAGGDWGAASDSVLTGAKAFTMGQFHLYGRYGNVLRFTAETYQYFNSLDLAYDWSARLRLQTEHVLGEFNQQLLIAQPYVQGRATTLNYLPDQNNYTEWRAGLRFELPF